MIILLEHKPDKVLNRCVCVYMCVCVCVCVRVCVNHSESSNGPHNSCQVTLIGLYCITSRYMRAQLHQQFSCIAEGSDKFKIHTQHIYTRSLSLSFSHTSQQHTRAKNIPPSSLHSDAAADCAQFLAMKPRSAAVRMCACVYVHVYMCVRISRVRELARIHM